MYCFSFSIPSPFLLQAVAILKRTKGKVSLVVARKQGLPGSPPASDKAPSASVSPRRDTGSPRAHKKGPPVAKKPVRESTSDAKKPASPRKAESPKTTEKPLEIVPTGSVLSASVPTGSAPTGSPLVSRREPVQTQAFEPVVQIVQQSPREAARKFITPFFPSIVPVIKVDLAENLQLSLDCLFDYFLSDFFFRHSCFTDANPASKSPHHTDYSRSRMCDRDSKR